MKPTPRVKRVLHMRAYGYSEPEPCFGLGWQTMNRRKCLAFESRRPWETLTVAVWIERFMRGVRVCWPDFLPKQEPVVEVFDYYVKA